ncbi:MAG: large conductance mechanosensitive channel protein MscL [Lachnospiraceae bacterium]|nr:large conductance mechanosensitive channel protein MscL [Lachnospiraceae bacterium]MBR3643167.1 large conductance mechanosensitive channel protein MscL [Parasporobacterium sp.]MBR7075298.1 large conductance mechanosensitive channel protein MscL [Lachnospiraceae bacterium]
MKKFFGEFKEFISKGNVMDMAVGIIVGGAFTAIVSALTDNIINPLIGSIFKMDFSDLAVTINGAELKYGAFIMAVINFIIIAFVLFLIVKGMNTLRAKAEEKKKKEEVEAAPTTKVCPFCKSEVSIDATRCPHCTSELSE